MKPRKLNNVAAAALLMLVFCLPAARAQALAPRVDARERVRLTTDAVRRGETLRHQWSLDAAEAAFREAIKLDAANLEARLGLSRIARARFDYRAALVWLNEVKAAGARSADWLAEYGTLYLAAEDAARARSYFDRAAAVDATNAAAII